MKYLKTFKIFEKTETQVVQKEYTQADIDKRWDKKRGQIKTLSNNIDKFKYKITKDLSSSDEKTKIIATILKIMEITGERIGNDDSITNGHFGISNLRKKHIKVNGNTVSLNYVGKSGVKHEREFTNPKIASILKDLMKRKTEDIFSTEDGISIKNTQINKYLQQFNITSKDLRGFKSNKLMIDELKKLGKVKEEKDRKKIFNELLRKVAEKIGHLPSTLRKHYLLPEIEENFYKHGSIGRIKKL